MSSQSVFIKVFPTKSGRFRARVDYPCGEMPVGIDLESRILRNAPRRRVEEITIGGTAWERGKLSEYHATILEKLHMTVFSLVSECFNQCGQPTRLCLKNGNSTFTIIHGTI